MSTTPDYCDIVDRLPGESVRDRAIRLLHSMVGASGYRYATLRYVIEHEPGNGWRFECLPGWRIDECGTTDDDPLFQRFEGTLAEARAHATDLVAHEPSRPIGIAA